MSEKSWASLAPLLDNRRYVESIVAGIKIKAHPQFRLVATMNDDASTFELPEYIHSRLQPQIFIDFPGARRGVPHPAREPAVRRRAHPRIRHRFSADGARRRRALHGARRHQRGPLRHQAEEPGHRSGRTRPRPWKPPSSRCSERKPCAMSGEIDPPIPDAGQPRARPVHVFSGGAGPPGIRDRGAPGHPARAPAGGRPGTARHACSTLGCGAVERLPRDVADLLSGRIRRTATRRSTCRSSRPIRSPRPSAPASKSAPRSSSPIPKPANVRT